MVLRGVRGGFPYSYYQDILWINWFIQVTSTLSLWFIMIYFSIPIYAVYKTGWLSKGDKGTVPVEETQIERELREKREKRQERRRSKP